MWTSASPLRRSSFGLADDEAFWSWIAHHSPLVREKAWFKRETIEELADEVQNHGSNDGEDGEDGEDEEATEAKA